MGILIQYIRKTDNGLGMIAVRFMAKTNQIVNAGSLLALGHASLQKGQGFKVA